MNNAANTLKYFVATEGQKSYHSYTIGALIKCHTVCTVKYDSEFFKEKVVRAHLLIPE